MNGRLLATTLGFHFTGLMFHSYSGLGGVVKGELVIQLEQVVFNGTDI